MKRIKRIYVPILIVIYCFVVGSCIQEDTITPNPGPNPPSEEGEKVIVELYSESSLYTLPVSRAVADESRVSSPPMVLIFIGSDMNALFSEAVQSVDNAGVMKVELTSTTSPCVALIVANMPGDKFFNGSSEIDFTPDNLTTAFAGKSLVDIESEGLFRTISFTSPLQTELPFSTTTSVLPMAGIYQLSGGISSDISIGSVGDEVLLTRAVSKTTIKTDSSLDSDFTMHWMGVINAPCSGNLYRTGGNIYADDFTHYMKSMSGDGVTGMVEMVNNTNESNPVYLYESAISAGTAFIIKASYKGRDYFYKLPFYDETNEVYIDNYRNKHYIFTITKVGEGYASMTDAINGLAAVLNYNITVRDAYSHEITTNGHYYLGFTNTEVVVYDTRDITLTNAFTVVTDAWTGLGVTSARVIPTNGIVVTPTQISLPTSAGTTVTPVSVTMPASVSSAKITIDLGNLSKTVTFTRNGFMSYTGTMALPYSDYFSCELINRGVGNWLAVSDGRYTSNEGFMFDTPGPLYLKADPNTSSSTATIKTGGELYVVRDIQENVLKKTKIFVSQGVGE